VKRIVYTSLLRADTSALSLAHEHRETEAELKASGLLFTILRDGWYTENYTTSVPSAVSAARSWAARAMAGSRQPRGWTTPRQL
jgi:NAD(P)H dehydrogenase (quinone)